jgi:hypothetical protein
MLFIKWLDKKLGYWASFTLAFLATVIRLVSLLIAMLIDVATSTCSIDYVIGALSNSFTDYL